MNKKIVLFLLFFLFTFAVRLQAPNAQVKKDANPQLKISRTDLETADYKKVVLLTEMDVYYDEHVDAGKIGLTEAMIRKECEFRLGEAGLESVSGFTRSEYLSVKVSVKFRSFYIAIQFNRPVLYPVQEMQFTKYGAITWQRIVLGQHGYVKEYILESLRTLVEEFTRDYLRTNSK